MAVEAVETALAEYLRHGNPTLTSGLHMRAKLDAALVNAVAGAVDSFKDSAARSAKASHLQTWLMVILTIVLAVGEGVQAIMAFLTYSNAP